MNRYAIIQGAGLLFLGVICTSCSKNNSEQAWAKIRGTNQDFQFRWPVPIEFQFLEITEENGLRKMSRQTVGLTRSNGELRLTWLKLEPLRNDGRELTYDQKDYVEKLMPSGRPPWPVWKISSDGKFLGTEGVEKTFEAVSKLPGINEKVKETLPQLGRMPESQRFIDNSQGEYWITWVQAWSSFEVPAGQSITNEGVIRLPPLDKAVKMVVVRRNLGPVPRATNLVHLKWESRMEGKELAEYTLETYAHYRTNLSSNDLSYVTREVTYEVQIDPANLRPHWAQLVKYLTYDGPISGKRTSVESRVYRFTWDSK